MRELTDRTQDNSTDGEDSWRGFSYFDVIDNVLPSTFDFGPDIKDSQRCWVGYLRSTDEFLCAFDLWLDIEDQDDELEPSQLMCGGVLVVRLSIVDGALLATPGQTERFPQSIYSGTKKLLLARHADLVEVDLD